MTTNFTLLRRLTITSASNPSSITLSSIPQTFDHLKLIFNARSTGGSTYTAIQMNINGDATSANYRTAYAEAYNNSTSGSANQQYRDAGYAAGVSVASQVFGGVEITMPNYTTNGTNKAWTIDSGYGADSLLIPVDLVSNIWLGTAPVTSLVLTLNAGNFATGSTFEIYGMTNQATAPVSLPKASGGEIIVNDGTYWYHAFTSSGVFAPNQTLSCDALIIGGGGAGGGGGSGGGGGAGGVFVPTTQSLAAINYVVTVGAGGVCPSNGNDSQFGSLTLAKGGGAGSISGGSGGSGGGGYPGDSAGTSNQSSTGGTGYGNAGGNGVTPFAPPFASGGGGGSGSAGTTGSGTTTGAGGAGLNTWSSWLSATGLGVSGFIAGGGGGGANQQYPGASAGIAGSGGGGTGGISGGTGTAGTVNTGSGGGGSSKQPAGAGTGGSGGSGLVIVRYPMA